MFKLFVGCFILFFFVLLFVGIRIMVNTIKLLNYLKKFHYEKWKYVTTWGNMGPGFYNTPRLFSFVFNPDDLKDPEVMKSKVKLKRGMIYFITGFISELIILILIFFSVFSRFAST